MTSSFSKIFQEFKMLGIWSLLFVLVSVKAMSLSSNIATCKGSFDIYFVLDKSGSLKNGDYNHFREETVHFTENLIKLFTSPLMRLSFITFSDEADVIMTLTSDRKEIGEKLDEMRKIEPEGGTNLSYGLYRVRNQIRLYGMQRASVVIIITDGAVVDNYPRSFELATELKEDMGVMLMAIGVGEFEKIHLPRIVGEDHVFEAKNFKEMLSLTGQIIKGSCVEITSVSPANICEQYSFPKFEVWGRGFNKTGNALCGFRFNESKKILVEPTYVRDDYMECPAPEGEQLHLVAGQNFTLQVSLNGGISFITSNVTVSSVHCHEYGLAIGLSLIPFMLFMLWWFWQAMCCYMKPKEEVPAAPLLPIQPANKTPSIEKKQWPTVDCSMYGRRGIGGIAPMRVDWGEKGCTEAGIHLERAKDAKEVGFVERDVVVDKQLILEEEEEDAQAASCCGKLKKYLGRLFKRVADFYKRIALKRPDRNDVRTCNCFRNDVKV